MSATEPTHTLEQVVVSRMTVVKKGANGKRWFLRKSADDEPVALGEPARLLKGSADWSTAYVIVAEPGWVEQGGQGAPGVADVWKSADEIEKAAHGFMAAGGDVNRLVHGSATDPNLRIVENAVALADFQVDGTTIKKGSWYVGVQLDADARAMVEKGEITGVSIEGIGVRTEVGKAAPTDRSVMVALYPPAEVANALAIDGGEHPADLHLTLAYLGDVPDDRVHLVVAAVEDAVRSLDTDGLSGMVAGGGTFAAGTGPGASKPVHYASIDAPSLPALRQNVVRMLEAHGVPARADHGFTPHVTLKYGGVSTPRVEARPVTFAAVHVVRGDRDVAAIALRPNTVPESVITKGKLDRSPKANWVESAGGLPKYIESIADSLHREKGMSISRAIATAVSRVKVWAAGGDGVKPDTRAKAQAALAQWEALKAKSKAQSAVKKESIVSKVLDTLRKAFDKGEDSLDAEERALIEKIAAEATPGSATAAGTVEKTTPSGATEEDTMDAKTLTDALAKALEPTTEALKKTDERLAKLEKAATPAPEAPTVESLAKDVDEFTGGVVAKLDQLQKSLETLAAGSSQQAQGTTVQKSRDGSGKDAWEGRGILFGD